MKRIVKYIFSKAGFNITRKIKSNGSTHIKVNEFDYETITPLANYAPWLADSEFQKVYTQVKENTLIDIYRCYELWELADVVYKLDNTSSFIEIGVWRGGSAGIIAGKLHLLNSNSNFYLCDTFKGVVKATQKDNLYRGGEHADTSQEVVEALLKNRYHKFKILKGIFPDETSQTIPDDEKFGYCHIDVDVYDGARDIVNWIWNKLIIGGAIIFDDYGFDACNGVTKYVNEQKELTDRIIIHNLNGHAIMIKLR